MIPVELQHVILRSLEQYQVFLTSKLKENQLPFSNSVLHCEMGRVDKAIHFVSKGTDELQQRIEYIKQELQKLEKGVEKSIKGTMHNLQELEVFYQSEKGFILMMNQAEILTTIDMNVVAKAFTTLML